MDSRSVTPGGAFFAIRGAHHDGFHYISDAVERGACVIFSSKIPKDPAPSVTYLALTDPRAALSIASAHFHGHPSRDLPVIGITGTDGKSTTLWFMFQLLKALGLQPGFLSTVASCLGKDLQYNMLHQTTPEAPTVHEALARMRQEGCDLALLESTSHGLSDRTHRLRDVHYYGAVYTPIAHEHLEFHKSFDQYLSDKKNLLTRINTESSFPHIAHPPFAIFDLGNTHNVSLLQVEHIPVYGYAVQNPLTSNFRCPMLLAEDIHEELTTTSFTAVWGKEKMSLRIPIPSRMNVGNVLAAVLSSSLISGIPVFDLFQHCEALTLPKGRMQYIETSLPFIPIVDFAHTPQAFNKLLSFLNAQKKSRLITVFGSAGERDKEKRILQGAEAARYADIIVLSDEDPRSEEPMAILEEIEQGILQEAGEKFVRGENLFLIPDRKTAIDFTIDFARMNDILAFLGKGHETSIIYRDKEIPWDEVKILQKSLTRHQA